MPYYEDQNYYQRQPGRPMPTGNQYPDWWPSQSRQRPQPPMEPTMLPGRFVNSDNDVYPNSIPNDGSIAVFPLNDFSAVYLKKWEPNGTITSVRYIPDVQPTQQTQEQAFQSEVQQRLGRLEDMLGALAALWQTPSTTTQTQTADSKESK